MSVRFSRHLAVVCFCLMPVIINAQQTKSADGINTIALHAIHNNSSFRIKESHQQLTAIVFLSPDCPISQNYTLTLNQLHQMYQGKLSIVGVFPGTYYKNQAYIKFEEKYKVGFKLFKDESNMMVKKLGATVTPQVFLINSAQQVIYSGAIDDWAVSLGKMRRAASVHYLQDAIANTLEGVPVKLAKTKAVGCFIN